VKVVGILHATVISSDLDRSRAFFEGILGLKPRSDRPKMSFDGIWYDVGPNQQIHLMRLPNPDAGMQRPEHGGRDRHIALAIEDVEALRVKFEAAGIPYTRSQSGRPVIFGRDPDENAFEFIEVK
jgi:catechol 2,3-dioxygenase-like lactoylglutathione lyase family enzyme